MGVLKERLDAAVGVAPEDCGMSDVCGEEFPPHGVLCIACELLDSNHCSRCTAHERTP